MKMEAGMVVMTRWDDSVKPIKGTIVHVYRGHREQKGLIDLVTGTRETIVAEQIVKVCKK